jgi:hypothetical protein
MSQKPTCPLIKDSLNTQMLDEPKIFFLEFYMGVSNSDMYVYIYIYLYTHIKDVWGFLIAIR